LFVIISTAKPAFVEKTDGNTSWLELPDSDSEYEHEESHVNDVITAPRVSKVSSAQSSKKGKKNSKVLPPDQRRITSFFVPQMKVNHTKLVGTVYLIILYIQILK